MRVFFAFMILGMVIVSAVIALGLMLYMLGIIGH
jgi:hypothetical protein